MTRWSFDLFRKGIKEANAGTGNRNVKKIPFVCLKKKVFLFFREEVEEKEIACGLIGEQFVNV